jgi:ABC-2 type transport system permease protein
MLHTRGAQISLAGVTALQVADTGAFKVTTLVSSPAATTWFTPIKPDPEASRISFSKTRGDEKGPLPLVMGLSRQVAGKEQRIIIAGDADLLSNAEIFRRSPEVQNFAFGSGLFRWFTGGAYPLDTRRPDTYDNHIVMAPDNLIWLKMAMIGVFPGLLLIAGSTLLIIRRKR